MNDKSLKTYHIYDKSTNPPILKGTVNVRNTHNETADEAAARRGLELVGHDNFEHKEVKETLADKAALHLKRMADLFRDY